MTTGDLMWKCPNCGLTMYQAYMSMHMSTCRPLTLKTNPSILPVEFAAKMVEIGEGGDPEGAHTAADKLLCTVLRQLGYDTGITVYELMTKWYA